MKDIYVKTAAALLLGFLVPGAVIGLAKSPQLPQNKSTLSSTAATNEQTELPSRIWVRTEDGETVQMDLEAYLVGVILAEMPTSYEPAALQAQAVAARTYALKRQQEIRHPQGAVCTDAGCCQAYVSQEAYLDGLGYEEDILLAKSAVDATTGWVVTYDDRYIEATYFHCSGGQTEEAVAVWGVDYPYLQAVESPGEEEMEHFTDSIFYTKEELETRLNRKLYGPASSWVGWTSYTAGGGVEKIYLAGVGYSGAELRRMLELNSTAISIEPEDDGLVFTTLGKGHRVGMSQSGAQVMALQGRSWQEIIAHYYPGTRIDKIEEVG